MQLNKLTKSHLKTLIDWARNEGWNPGEFDYEVFWETDPDGFYGFFESDKLIAGGAIVSYNGKFGFMGLFIVHPDYRNKGLGRQLWFLRRDKLISRLDEGASIGMDGVVAMQPFYSKGGFEIYYKDERYERLGEQFHISEFISNIELKDFELISAYDKKCFGFCRDDFLYNWLKMSNAKTFKYKGERSLMGFAVLRKVIEGYKIGPLFADNYNVAQELYKACLNAAVGANVYLDIPMLNENAVKLVKAFKAKYVFECARMYYNSPPEIEINKLFGITTFELG